MLHRRHVIFFIACLVLGCPLSCNTETAGEQWPKVQYLSNGENYIAFVQFDTTGQKGSKFAAMVKYHKNGTYAYREFDKNFMTTCMDNKNVVHYGCVKPDSVFILIDFPSKFVQGVHYKATTISGGRWNQENQGFEIPPFEVGIPKSEVLKPGGVRVSLWTKISEKYYEDPKLSECFKAFDSRKDRSIEFVPPIIVNKESMLNYWVCEW